MPKTLNPAHSQFEALLAFDADVKKRLKKTCALIGADEVGRGSLIGPVVAAAVCLPNTIDDDLREMLALLNDSKKLTPTLRATLYDVIIANMAVGIGEAQKEEVETLNVHHASLLAINRAYQTLCKNAKLAGCDTFLLIDGRATLPDLPPEQQQAVIKGDGQSAAIAAASVVAKHYRDQMIINFAKQYPGYGWESNMGYPTPAHQRAITEFGITPLHRQTYKTVQQKLALQ